MGLVCAEQSPLERTLARRLRDMEEALSEAQALVRQCTAPEVIYAPKAWGLKGQHKRMLWRLARTGLASKRQLAFAAIGPDAMERCHITSGGKEAWDAHLKVLVSQTRKNLRPHGVTIETQWGQGYRLPPESLAIVRAGLSQ